MKRLMLGMAVMAALADPAMARTVEERLLAGLRDQGYVIVEDGYTFLGRLRVVAQSDRFDREIVVNPGTGEVLRDYVVERTDTESDQTPRPATPKLSGVEPVVPAANPAATATASGAGDAAVGVAGIGAGVAASDGSATTDPGGDVTSAAPETGVDPIETGKVMDDGGDAATGGAVDTGGAEAEAPDVADSPADIVSEPAVTVEEASP